jgi:alpha-L-fucosidase
MKKIEPTVLSAENKSAVQEQHAALGLDLSKTSSHTTHPGAQWFPLAGLGLFIHWGIASVHGDLDLSWSMIANTTYDAAAKGRNKVTPEEYWPLADRFRPDRYDPDKWLAAAAAAGIQYAVLTTMHHDGYTLWPSRHGEFGVQSHLNGLDLVGPFIEACRKHGLRIGLYYSPPDWHFDRAYKSFNYRSEGPQAERPAYNTRHEITSLPSKPPGHDARGRELFHQRVEELLTRYGHIDLLWFDGGAHDNAIRDRIRELQPHIVINSRSCDGDFDCTECSLPTERFTGWFETPHCWQHSDLQAPTGSNIDFWGYLKEEQYKSTAWMLESLVRLRTWGGNFLVNVGPRPNGELPEIVYDRLAETAQWMAHSKQSVIGTLPGPYPEKCNVPVTRDPGGKTWYLHALPESSGEIELHLKGEYPSVKLLRTGEPLTSTYDNGILRIKIPSFLRTALVDVVAVDVQT